MKKKILLKLSIIIIPIFIIYLCITYSPNTNLKGTYKSVNPINNYSVQISIDPTDQTFVEYIDQRSVDKGSFIKNSKNSYTLKSNKQKFNITLNDNNSFDIFIFKINGDQSITLKNVSTVPSYISTIFEDEENYINLLP